MPFPIAIDILMAFITEGVKILYRFTYAIIKYHKDFIKNQTDPGMFVSLLREKCRNDTDPVALKKIAFKYGLKSQHTQFH